MRANGDSSGGRDVSIPSTRVICSTIALAGRPPKRANRSSRCTPVNVCVRSLRKCANPSNVSSSLIVFSARPPWRRSRCAARSRRVFRLTYAASLRSGPDSPQRSQRPQRQKTSRRRAAGAAWDGQSSCGPTPALAPSGSASAFHDLMDDQPPNSSPQKAQRLQRAGDDSAGRDTTTFVIGLHQ